MRLDSRLQSILLAVLGILFTAIYFWLFAHTQATQLIRLHLSKDEILEKAEQAFKQSPLGQYHWRRSLRASINDDLFRYAQTSANDSVKTTLPPLGQWAISWEGKFAAKENSPIVVKIDSDQKKKESGSFAVRYDFDGNLVGLEQSLPKAPGPSNLSDTQALQKVKYFLDSLQVDTTSVTLTKRAISQEEDGTKYTYSFAHSASTTGDWQQTFKIGILGPAVTEYSAEIELQENVKQAKAEKVSDLVAGILTAIIWVIISIFVLVIFFRRLRHDELEFKRAIWVGILVGAAMWIMVAIESWGEWGGMLLGGGFSGLFIGGGMVILYAATESFLRDVWKEKLALSDLLFHGYLRVKEMGHAILRAFFMAGVTLLLMGGTIWLVSQLNIGYIAIEDDDLWLLQGQFQVIAAICLIVMTSSFISFMFLGFWPAYLRSKIQRYTILIAVSGLFFGFSGFQLNFIKPSYIAFILFLPIAMLWAWFAYRSDLVTSLLAVLAVTYFLNLSLIMLAPETFFNVTGVITGILVLIFFVVGVALVYNKKSVQEFENYVPAYVSRIAERERFLKELEIARSIQMRFLPATAPTFPRLEIACLCRPAMEVGGDYYDFVRHDDHRLAVIIGDVSGKGVSAAFFMTMAKGIIKALSKINPSPKSLLSDMNTVFYENTPKEVFISLIYGLFDMQSNSLTFARAGHNPLIVRKSLSGAPELLNPRGLAIGLEKGAVFAATIEEKTVPIQPGDVFVFYTDGISESMNKNGDEFGEERLGQLINQHANEAAPALLESITKEVTHFASGTNQHDDFTMVVVKVVK